MNFKKIIQFPIFESRWILMVFYLGLIVAQVGYCAKFCQKVIEVFHGFTSSTESDFLLIVLNLLDMVMIANLMNYPPAKASGFPRLISFLVLWFIDLITLSVLPDTILNASPHFCLSCDLVPKPHKSCFSIFREAL